MNRCREVLSVAFTCVLVAAALVVVALAIHRGTSGVRGTAVQSVREISDWERLAAGGTTLGHAGAPVKIVVFSDFQCPFCADAVDEINRLRGIAPERIAVIFRHLPIEAVHPHAFTAATAAECAGAQQRFEAYHDALFASQPLIGIRTWTDFAQEAGVPAIEAFERCVASGDFRDRVRRDIALARAAGVEMTPTFVYNGLMSAGVQGLARLEEHVRKTLFEWEKPLQ